MSDILIQLGIADFIAFSDNLHNLFDFPVGIWKEVELPLSSWKKCTAVPQEELKSLGTGCNCALFPSFNFAF